ncbi:unnamed protein product [Discosporangium mesarthrocarpum]
MLAREEEVDVEVRWEDQQSINEFGTLNTRLQEITQDKAHIKDVLDKLDDASTELMTGEGEDVKLMLGECFMECSEEVATDFCEKKQEVMMMMMMVMKKKMMMPRRNVKTVSSQPDADRHQTEETSAIRLNLPLYPLTGSWAVPVAASGPFLRPSCSNNRRG